MKNLLKIVGALALGAMLLTGCKKDDKTTEDEVKTEAKTGEEEAKTEEAKTGE